MTIAEGDTVFRALVEISEDPQCEVLEGRVMTVFPSGEGIVVCRSVLWDLSDGWRAHRREAVSDARLAISGGIVALNELLAAVRAEG